MKKAFKIFSLLSIVSILSYWSYTWYNNTASLLGVIHKDADSTIKISIHDIKETLVLDAITTPSYYYNNTSLKEKETDKDSIDSKGINFFPYNLVLFTVPEQKNIWFTTLNIKDTNAFNIQIEQYANYKGLTHHIDKDNDLHWLENKKLHWACAWNTEKLIISIGLENSYQKSKKIFLDVLKYDKVINSKDEEWIKSLSQTKKHITYLSKKSKISLQFKDGEAVLEGILKTKEVGVYPEKVSYAKMPNASIAFYWDGNFKKAKNRARFIKSWTNHSFFKKMNIELPKITELTNGFFYMGVDGTTTQTDTIITYSYDDNFNKIAQKSHQKKEVPNIFLSLGKQKHSLKTYLSQQKLITPNAIFTGIPYYQFTIHEDSTNTFFKTGKLTNSLEQVTSPNFMNLSVNFNKAKEDLQIPQLAPYFNLLKKLQVSARQSNNNEVLLKGRINGKIEHINLLSQIIFGLDHNKD